MKRLETLSQRVGVTQSFESAYVQLVRGDSGMILESSINPASGLPNQADVGKAQISADRTKEARVFLFVVLVLGVS